MYHITRGNRRVYFQHFMPILQMRSGLFRERVSQCSHVRANADCQNVLPYRATSFAAITRSHQLPLQGVLSDFASEEAKWRRSNDILLLVWLYKPFARPS